MAVVIGGPVVWNAQALADAIKNQFPDLSHISTYPGHDPDQQHGLDIFPRDSAQGDEIAEWLKVNGEKYGEDYFIWWQRIWNPPDRSFWRDMADRGGITANHKDHLHISLLDMIMEEIFMALTDKQQEELYEFAKAAAADSASTNKEVATLAVVIRDPQFGLAKVVEDMRRELDELTGKK